MVKRLITAIGLLAFVFACVFWLRQYTLIATDFVIMLFAIVGSYELFNCFKKGKYSTAEACINNGEVVIKESNIKPIGIAIVCADIMVYPLTYFFNEVGVLATLCLSTIIAVSIFVFKKDNYEIKDLCATIFTIVYPVIIMGLLVVMNHSEMAMLSIFSVFAVVVMTDTMAYFVGVTCKGPKLCPKISPKKTISGAVGGIVGGMIGMTISYLIISHFGLLASLFPNEMQAITNNVGINLAIMLPLGAICSVSAELGDLGASIIKRKVGIKDFGNIFPGHGGVMDRIDSFLFVVPIMYLAFEIIYKVVL